MPISPDDVLRSHDAATGDLGAAARPDRQARAATTAVFFANGLGIGAWAATIPHLKAVLALSDGALSVPLLAFAGGAILAMPAAGLVAPRVGTGRAARLALVVFALALVWPGLAPSLATLSIAAAILGAVNGALDVLMNAHASEVERHYGRPIMSAFHAAFSAGGLVGAGFGGLLVVHGASALGAAALSAAALGAACWRRISVGARAVDAAPLALPGRATLPLGAVALVSMLCEGAVADWSAVYLATVAGASLAMSAAGYAAFSATMVLGRLTGDATSRALGRRRVVRLGGGLAVAGLALAVAAPWPWSAALGFALVGLGLANVVPSAFSAAGQASGATGIAAVATLGYAGFLLGPPLIGVIATLAGLGAALGALACLAMAIVALAGRLRAA